MNNTYTASEIYRLLKLSLLPHDSKMNLHNIGRVKKSKVANDDVATLLVQQCSTSAKKSDWADPAIIIGKYRKSRTAFAKLAPEGLNWLVQTILDNLQYLNARISNDILEQNVNKETVGKEKIVSTPSIPGALVTSEKIHQVYQSEDDNLLQMRTFQNVVQPEMAENTHSQTTEQPRQPKENATNLTITEIESADVHVSPENNSSEDLSNPFNPDTSLQASQQILAPATHADGPAETPEENSLYPESLASHEILDKEAENKSSTAVHLFSTWDSTTAGTRKRALPPL
jgi:hypothetical protein